MRDARIINNTCSVCNERETSVMCLLRLRRQCGLWLWVHVVLTLKPHQNAPIITHYEAHNNNVAQKQSKYFIIAVCQVVRFVRIRIVTTTMTIICSDTESRILQSATWLYTIRPPFPTQSDDVTMPTSTTYSDDEKYVYTCKYIIDCIIFVEM
jgi:hypothetical protein